MITSIFFQLISLLLDSTTLWNYWKSLDHTETLFCLDVTGRSGIFHQLCWWHGATSFKMHVKFTYLHVAESVFFVCFFSTYLRYNKFDLARQFCVSNFWEIPRSLESINVSSNWLAESTGTRNPLCSWVITKGWPTCWSNK